jgi:hypothetical protein
MTLRTLLLIGTLVMFSGCSKDEAPPAPVQQDAAAVTELEAAEAEPVAAAGTTEAAEATEKVAAGTYAFIEHMHEHAMQLGHIIKALDAGDLEAAATPAYWLSRHEGVTGPLYDWEDYLNQMRGGAVDVANATDLETARAGVMKIEEGCNGCHTSAGAYVPDLLPRSM